jgi:hypothetical protein
MCRSKPRSGVNFCPHWKFPNRGSRMIFAARAGFRLINALLGKWFHWFETLCFRSKDISVREPLPCRSFHTSSTNSSPTVLPAHTAMLESRPWIAPQTNSQSKCHCAMEHTLALRGSRWRGVRYGRRQTYARSAAEQSGDYYRW